jgi:hypothetical protein
MGPYGEATLTMTGFKGDPNDQINQDRAFAISHLLQYYVLRTQH